ncbi:MAG: TssQ family T6SS-associated lipoprotein [Pigmentiphaga sp.]|uniref:TssQ family T6SS-associated lipoprotein n=1 Tax=Pigmentiphaga sp. TaxID=1977564 RepID=UPI0029B0A31C|nr:TssQ family T6SS-associated lipoprotein [Pigmentiphaga sp.]MDX3905815.1 TssQ family T6SS-associated lipoprotein [Pigmentiphaga sp.]
MFRLQAHRTRPARGIPVAALFLCVGSLAACSTVKNDSPPSPGQAYQAARQEGPSAEAVAALQALRAAYDAGDYGRTIRLAATDARLQEARSVQQEALKLSAFSYCLTGHTALCREQFARLLAIDPGFELGAAERGHPIWGKEFATVRDARGNGG